MTRFPARCPITKPGFPPALSPVNRVDVGVSTKPYRGYSFSIWGRNLASDRHPETIGYLFTNGEIPRSLTFKVVWESVGDQGK